MKRKHSLLYLIIAFVFAQLAWLALLGLWIYWYVTNYLIFEQVGNPLSPQLAIDSPNVLIFVLGIILMVAIEIAMVLAFRNLTVQMKLTNLYDNFIGNVSHELKSPLSSIQLYLETLSTKEVPIEKQKEFYDMMKRDTDRLKKLISSILEISKLEQKRIAYDYHIYNANDIIKELDINVKLSHNQKNIFIEFCDKGIGIHPKDQKRIFDKFQRIANANVPNVKGTGLGLYWAREIIKFHGGKISVFSLGIGKGTTFRIKLPIYKTSRNIYVNSLLRRTAKNQKILESSDGE